MSSSAWNWAADLVESYLKEPRRDDDLLQTSAHELGHLDRRRGQALFLGVVRHLLLIRLTGEELIPRLPKPRLRAVLYLGIFELADVSGRAIGQIVDHAVGRAKSRVSIPEARLVNAVLRKVPGRLIRIRERARESGDPEDLAVATSHPTWMVARWKCRYGREATRRLLDWNQSPPPIYAVVANDRRGAQGGDLMATEWEGVYAVSDAGWLPLRRQLEEGRAYVMDPASRIPVDLLDPHVGESILDLCAAPGGKSWLLAQRIGGAGSGLVCVDLPGRRLERLRQNLTRQGTGSFQVIGCDLEELTDARLQSRGVGERFDAVLLDAPCSNTGVLRRRPDAKWRLRKSDIQRQAAIQFRLLTCAGRFVKAGGRLLYSTCSLEREENEEVVARFLSSRAGDHFELRRQKLSFPWIDRHDGGGAFLLARAR